VKAKDIMTAPVVTARADTSVQDAARLMVKRRISAVPVVDESDRILGIVSEGDLVRRAEIGTGTPERSWWLRLIGEPAEDAARFVRTHATRIGDIMTRPVVTIAEDAPVQEIADLLERRNVKRLPVTRDGRVVGIVSRANLVALLARRRTRRAAAAQQNDDEIRAEFLAQLRQTEWASVGEAQITVKDGVITLRGIVNSEAERDATRILAEEITGVQRVEDRREVIPLVLSY
jgi:CBS domain-containing protein